MKEVNEIALRRVINSNWLESINYRVLGDWHLDHDNVKLANRYHKRADQIDLLVLFIEQAKSLGFSISDYRACNNITKSWFSIRFEKNEVSQNEVSQNFWQKLSHFFSKGKSFLLSGELNKGSYKIENWYFSLNDNFILRKELEKIFNWSL